MPTYKLVTLGGRNSSNINVNYFTVFRGSSANMAKKLNLESKSIQIETEKLAAIRSSLAVSDLLYRVVLFNFHVYY